MTRFEYARPQPTFEGESNARAAMGEAVGTFILVLTIASTVVAASLAKPIAGEPYGSVAVPVAGGLALAVLVAVFGPLSGAHLNPAVTVSLALIGRFRWRSVPSYVAAQFGGAIAAALTVWAIFGHQARTAVHLAASYPAVGAGAWRAFGAEAAGTFILVLAVVSVTADQRAGPALAASTIGAALAAAILVSGPISGAGINPARAIGPMIVAGKFTDWWVYATAPFLGATLAVTFYQKVLGTEDRSEQEEP